MTSQTPPGWYRDPYGTPGLQRYWDGNQWTQVTQPADEWGTGGGGAQEAPSGYQPGGADGQSAPGYPPGGAEGQAGPEYGQQAGSEYGQQQAAGYGYQQAPGYGQQQPGWPPPDGGAGWNTGGQQAWPQQPPTSGKSNKGLMWALAGGGAVVVALIVVVALFATGIIGGDGTVSASGSSSSGSTSASPETSSSPGGGGAGGRAPVTGTTTDSVTRLSYARLGGTWKAPELVPPGSGLGKLGFSRGAIATVQANYDGSGSPYVSSVYSGVFDPFARTGSLEQAAKGLFTAVYPDSYPTPNTRRDLESRSHTVSGKKAWIYKVQMSFPQAKAENWNFTKETAVVVTVEVEIGVPPAFLYISIPDSHKTPGDLDLLLSSLKVQ